ncbi:nuclear transport factor 2 family protein [Kribbella solani]|uniref:nuclear transport factor 2 family protein n=1 Tax=Kribbella solani TaxID=236067 RepID=UPI0029B5B3D8|nr:nuclear transport factor 2 family protein [Kribbella solani]MDX2974414.1 nuclear transport factor 2 family protein [Kribbella solani]
MNDVLAAADLLEINDLYARYAHCFDLGEPGAAAELFTADGSFTRADGRVTCGRDQLRGLGEGTVGVRHLYTNIRIVADGKDRASGSCYNLRLRVDAGTAPVIHAFGLMTDVFIRTADGWRFQSRTSSSW